jgi:Tfp pilus assembly protein PilN
MHAVNLLPRDESTEGRRGPALPVLVGCVGLVLVAALIAVTYMSGSAKVGTQRKALQAATAEYLSIPAPAPPPAIDKQLPQEKQARVAALASVLGQRVSWDRLLREVSEVVPSDVWLTSLLATSPLNDPTPTATAAAAGTLPTGFQIEGCTYSQTSVARFLSRLQLVPDLGQMTLGRSEGGSSATADATSSAPSGGSSAGSCPGTMFAFTLDGNVRIGGSSS